MEQIRIFQSDEYPVELQQLRHYILEFSENTKKELLETKYLNDYASSKMWDSDSEFGRVHNKLMTVLEGYNIIAYHNTRLVDPSKIMRNGLIFSDERYIESLREDMQQQEITREMITDIIGKVIKERDRWEINGVNRRKMKFVLYLILITIKIMTNFWLHMAVSF